MKKVRIIGAALVAALWLGLAVFAWVKPADTVSSAERRPLEQFPTFSVENLLKSRRPEDSGAHWAIRFATGLEQVEIVGAFI